MATVKNKTFPSQLQNLQSLLAATGLRKGATTLAILTLFISWEMSCPSWQWHRAGYSWLQVQTLPVAPLWCDLELSSLVPNSRGNKAGTNLRLKRFHYCKFLAMVANSFSWKLSMDFAKNCFRVVRVTQTKAVPTALLNLSTTHGSLNAPMP